jgi:LysM repeat protein
MTSLVSSIVRRSEAGLTPRLLRWSATSAERSPLGAHSKPSSIRLSQGAAVAAAPALVGVAAVAVLAPQATPALAATTTSGTSTTSSGANAAPDTTGLPGPASVELLAASQAANKPVAAVTTAAEASSTRYTVRSGDSLSSISQHFYHNASKWPVLYWNNRRELRWADVIDPGEVLNIPSDPTHIPRPPGQLGPDYTPRHSTATTTVAPVRERAPTTTVDTSYTGGWPGGAFGACVVERESGGNPDIWNASGHWGLYQFSASTWAAYGGNPALFGSASVGEQEAVFMTALARGGEDNWAPYDGC